MNRQLWDNFLQQINAQVEGDFLALAQEYESVTGHPFTLDNNQALFSMLDQAMMTQDASLLRSTVEFIAQLPHRLQDEFRSFSRRRMHIHHQQHQQQHYMPARA